MALKARKRLLKWLFYFLIVALSNIASQLVQSSSLGSQAEQRSYDFRFRLRGPLPPLRDVSITILAVDEESFSRITDPFMLWQKHFARVIEELVQAGTAVVGVDFMFGEITAIDPEGQRNLLEALLKANAANVPVVLAYRVRGDRVEQPPPIFTMAAGDEAFAYVNLTTDSDDFVRRQEIFSELERKRVFSGFALAVARAFAQSRRRKIADPGERTILINYRGLDQFSSVPFWQALEASLRQNKEFFRSHFKNRIVLMGLVGDDDLHSTPLYYLAGTQRALKLPRRTPGIEIHANTIATLLESNSIRQLPDRTQMAITLLIIAVVAFLCLRFSPIVGISSSAFLIAVYLLIALYWSFERGWWLFVVSPVMGAMFALGSAQVTNFVLEGREKRQLRGLFKRYVNDQVIEKILHAPEGLALRGERKRITILFADIRDFTTRSERMPPEVLVNCLNQYFAAMVQAIQSHNGMVDKFIGDGIMAVFGAPLEDENSALHAAQAALGMLEALGNLNENFVSSSLEPIRIGIGLHVGEALIGNIGSPHKMEYTAIGDVVNTASRIEGLNRKYNSSILISGEMFQALSGTVRAEYLGDEVLKGKKLPVPIYRLR